MGGNDREKNDEEGRECSMPPLYTNKFNVSRCFFIYFQRTGLAEYLRLNEFIYLFFNKKRGYFAMQVATLLRKLAVGP